MKQPLIVIEVSGGTVTDVYSDTRVRVVLVDHDNIKQGDDPEEMESSGALEDIPIETLDLIYDADIDFPSLPWPYADKRRHDSA